MPGSQSIKEELCGVCAAWLGDRELGITAVEADGFSGARLFEVCCVASGAAWMLKSCPAAAVDRIGRAHGLMRHLRAAGIPEVPAVMATPDGRTLVVDRLGTPWELIERVAGIATDSPTLPQAAAAAVCLARVHAAAPMPGFPPRDDVPPAVVRRISHARTLLASPWSGREFWEPGKAGDGIRAAVRERLERSVAAFTAADGTAAVRRIAGIRPPVMALQPVLRDVWSDHVLYAEAEPARVAGIIDYHAAGIDTPATDIARLFGSWRAPSEREEMPLLVRWQDAVDAYDAVRPLSKSARNLVPWLHATGVIFGLDNWFRWLLAESREFLRPGRAFARLDRLLPQLPAAFSLLNDDAGSEV